MVLKPLEFSDCISDSPWFRQNLHEHEAVLEDAYKNIKCIEQQCRELINCNRKLSHAQRAFAKSLCDFKIETVGTNQTDDERVISTCLTEFGRLINQVEEQRQKILGQAEADYLEPLRKFRQEVIGRTLHDEKKKHEKESQKFYQSLEKHLHLSTVRKSDEDFREADAQLDMQQTNFCQASLQYVEEIQSVQERMKFEFVETISTFLYSWLSFYHVGHVVHEDFKPFLDGIQVKIQKTRESFKSTQREAEDLKKKILKTHTKISAGSECENQSEGTIRQGYLYVQEKSKISKTLARDVLRGSWTKYYCVYSKETRIFVMITANAPTKTDMKSAVGQSVSYKLKNCVRRPSDSIDKRFCFDILVEGRSDPFTLQALSEEDRRRWVDAMDGSTQTIGAGPSGSQLSTELDDVGFEFVHQCVRSIEEKGLLEQGLYRNCGVNSKVKKLMQMGLEKKVNWADDKEWETKTVSSALKTYLRNLPEPLMTFQLHPHFITAAKMDDRDLRVEHIHFYVHQLPPAHKEMLEILIRHLFKVAEHSENNLMSVGNLGVCFGPTLLRPKEETMAAIMDIKFCNVVVEVLIANFKRIFTTRPPASLGSPSASTWREEGVAPLRRVIGGACDSLESLVSVGSLSPRVPPVADHAASRGVFPLLDVSVDSAPCSTRSEEDGAASPPRSVAAPLVRAKTSSFHSISDFGPTGEVSSQSAQCVRVRTLYACTPDHESELSFQAGQIITNVYESKEDGWLVGTLNGKTGLIPANYVETL